MKVTAFEAIARELNEAHVPYLVVGGVAVNLHGYGRATYDVDLVIRLTPEAVARAFTAFARAGYRPLVPITAEQFGDSATRENLIETKQMIVLQFFSDAFPRTRLDVFVREPFDLESELSKALKGTTPSGIPFCAIGLDSLLRMKREAGRPKDLIDVEYLEKHVIRWK
jgi:hypothetical protein